jgi:hypothetical protein
LENDVLERQQDWRAAEDHTARLREQEQKALAAQRKKITAK